MMRAIGTIITYCTNDFRFIGKCIEEAKIFSKQIVVPVCDHFFDGKPENRHLLNHTYAQHPDCDFVEFAYLPDRLYSQYHNLKSNDPDWSMFSIATTRYIGFYYLKPEIDTVLFLDGDEIFEGGHFLSWFESGAHAAYEAMRLGAYYYALRPTLRAKKVVNLPLLVKRDAFAPLTLCNELDRIGAFLSHPGPKEERVVGLNGLPFVHHYSWVRTREESLLKARTWGHRHDEDWPTLIDEAFQGKLEHLFGSTHQFDEIEKGYFDPFQVPFPQNPPPLPGAHVKRITDRDLRIKEVEYALL